jgi:vitamin K-dependent gamma-carboxylase
LAVKSGAGGLAKIMKGTSRDSAIVNHPALPAPVDAASLAVFRMAFGLLMFVESIVYLKNGWVRELYVAPEFHFTFLGFDWVRPWPGDGMVVAFVIMAAASLMMAMGLFYRMAAIVLFLGITHVFLIDAAEYLNHLYLICLIAFLMIFAPATKIWSMDALRKPKPRDPNIPQVWIWLLRIQIGIPYFYGGIAKLNGDWLRGEPLRMWLARRSDYPGLGKWFTEEWVVYLFSYGGLLLDLAFVPLLLCKRTRMLGYGLVLCFNGMNAWLFDIGIFPWMMMAASLMFFPPDWPRFGRQKKPAISAHHEPLARPLLVGMAAWVAIQMLLPFRHWIYPGDVAWTEEGHLFSWRMKLRDKQSKEMTFRIRDPKTGHEWGIEPGDFLTERQKVRMAGQPDMIHQFAIHLAEEYRKEYGMQMEVRVDAVVSLNGGRPAPLIDPEIDLAAQPRDMWSKPWITRRP